MKITFLGTSSGAPSRTRNVSAIALQLPHQSGFWLFDCGEGTQHQIMRSPLRLSQMEKIFITHMHGDHVFGLPGLLASRSLQIGSVSPVTLYGPGVLEDFVRGALDRTRTRLGYPIRFVKVGPTPLHAEKSFQVVSAPMLHGVEAFGYAVIESDQPGHLDAEKAKALGVPPGPLYGRLKNGETVTLPDGRAVCGADLVGPPRPGRKVVFCGDTTYTPNAVHLAREADALIHEATYLQEDAPLAERANHSTSVMAAKVAQQANVKALLLTHFSPRYETESGSRLTDLLTEARALFPNTLLAHDFWSYEVPTRQSEGVKG